MCVGLSVCSLMLRLIKRRAQSALFIRDVFIPPPHPPGSLHAFCVFLGEGKDAPGLTKDISCVCKVSEFMEEVENFSVNFVIV